MICLNKSAKRRLEALECEAARRKPALMIVTTADGKEQRLSPVAAIDFAWSGGPGSLVDVETNRPEYAGLACTLAAVFGQ